MRPVWDATSSWPINMSFTATMAVLRDLGSCSMNLQRPDDTANLHHVITLPLAA